MNQRIRSGSRLFNETESEGPSFIFSLNQIDDFIMNREEIRQNDDGDNMVVTEEKEMQKFRKIESNIKGKQSFNQIIQLIRHSSFPMVRTRVKDFFMDFLLRHNEIIYSNSGIPELSRGSIRLSRADPKLAQMSDVEMFSFAISTIPDIIQFLPENDVCEMLEALATILPSVAPNPQLLRHVVHFKLYAEVANTCLQGLNKCLEIGIQPELINRFVSKVLSSVIVVAENVSASVRATKTHLAAYSGYIGEFIPFAAATEPLKPHRNTDLLRLLQQFWIICIFFSYNNTSVFFSQYSDALETLSRFLPPLVHTASRGSFASVKFRVQELLKILQPQELKKTEDLLPLFSRLLPSVSSKTVLSIGLTDAFFAISIYILEDLRAGYGIFGQVFDYLEGEYYPVFTTILEEMFNPIFNKLIKSLDDMVDPEKRIRCANYTMRILIKRFSSPSPRIQTRVDQCFRKFAISNPTVFTDKGVISALSECFSSLSEVNLQRQTVFMSVINELFLLSAQRMKYSFFSSLHHFLLSNTQSSFLSESKSSFLQLTQIIPIEYRDSFINEFIMKSIILGKSKYIKPDEFEHIETVTDKVLITSFYLISHPESIDLMLNSLFINAPKHILMMAWSNLSMSSEKLSNIMIQKMISYFIQTVQMKKGLFSNYYTPEDVHIQEAILQFFVEQLSQGKNMFLISQVFSVCQNQVIVDHPSVISPLCIFANLGCIVLTSSFDMCSKTRRQIQVFILKLAFVICSYTDFSQVFVYLDNDFLQFLKSLVTLLPEIIKESTQSNVEQFSAHSGSRSNAVISARSSYHHGRIPKSLVNASQRSNTNFIEQSASETQILPYLVSIANFLLCYQLQLFAAFLNQGNIPSSIQRLLALNQMKRGDMHLSLTIPFIWRLSPAVLYTMSNLPLISDSIVSITSQLIEKSVFCAAEISNLALLFQRSDRFRKSDLSVWKQLDPLKALALLTPEVMKEKPAAQYVIRCFNDFNSEDSLLFIPQLIQSLRFDACHVLADFLYTKSMEDDVFCHYLLWNILGEKDNRVHETDPLPSILVDLETRLITNMSHEQRSRYENEFSLIDRLDLVSQRLLPMEIPDRAPAVCDMLKELPLPEGVYIPSNPNYQIVSIDAEHSLALKSHARVPILVRFKVYDKNDENRNIIPFSCIFKIHDDVRQDAMMIQFIDTFKKIFVESGIDCFLYPYRVFSTGPKRGVIECIKDAKSRHDIGHATGEDLLAYFVSKYGQIGSPAFNNAQECFVKSMAPYSLICYLFQVKDRHNANIMIDDDGHVIHIDFGFIFEISPGGGLKFERAPFKLTKEMIAVMGGSKDSPAFIEFSKLLTKCFFAARTRHEEIEAIADLMRSAGFPCFRADSIRKLRDRFFVDYSPKEVVQKVVELIDNSYESVTTTGYDAFQKAQNNIFY